MKEILKLVLVGILLTSCIIENDNESSGYIMKYRGEILFNPKTSIDDRIVKLYKNDKLIKVGSLLDSSFYNSYDFNYNANNEINSIYAIDHYFTDEDKIKRQFKTEGGGFFYDNVDSTHIMEFNQNQQLILTSHIEDSSIFYIRKLKYNNQGLVESELATRYLRGEEASLYKTFYSYQKNNIDEYGNWTKRKAYVKSIFYYDFFEEPFVEFNDIPNIKSELNTFLTSPPEGIEPEIETREITYEVIE
ncbi:hypothetical protein OO013_02260 [Mangrovivirga sp. M17]|uniref:Lipoprotein n=1 Tax=Mangrovivirga halotolerans TaxID=2993936 RepID=A0ABT3RMD4_9BACT|nr:hypothetical protein [Mangrovivirga halotolerans]MCX2742668.1 hypothetical protein [Mangrovivirga halotolerans]